MASPARRRVQTKHSRAVSQDTSALPTSNGDKGRPILAIDYGRSRMGLAISDALGLTARPLAVYVRTNRRTDVARLREICRQHDVGIILVGCPLHLDGSMSEMAEETTRFADRLRKNLGLPVELVDERLSSWEAHQVQKQAAPRGSSSGSGRSNIDDIAAAVILRDYLSRRRGARD
jgi:putative holliday junction resolvase